MSKHQGTEPSPEHATMKESFVKRYCSLYAEAHICDILGSQDTHLRMIEDNLAANSLAKARAKARAREAAEAPSPNLMHYSSKSGAVSPWELRGDNHSVHTENPSLNPGYAAFLSKKGSQVESLFNLQPINGDKTCYKCG